MKDTQCRRTAILGTSVVLSTVLATAMVPNVAPMLAMGEDVHEEQNTDVEEAKEPQKTGDLVSDALETRALESGELGTKDSVTGEPEAIDQKASDSYRDGLETDGKDDEGPKESEREETQDAEAEKPREPEAVEYVGYGAMTPQANDFYLEVQSDESGCSSVSKLTLDEQRAAFDALPDHPDIDDVWAVKPNVDAYTPGTLSSESIEYVTEYLNLMRRIAGVNGVTFTPELNASAAQGALILARNDTITHDPVTPSNVTDAQAQPGKLAAKLSFLNMSGPKDHLHKLITTYLNDDFLDALERLAHRTMLLDPRTQTMGVGSALSKSNHAYSAILAHGDGIRYADISDFDYLAWPPSGAMLSELFPVGAPWLVALNLDRYSMPSLDSVSVVLTRVSDGRSWTFNAGDNGSATLKNEYFNVVTKVEGIGNRIVFSPGTNNLDIDAYEGQYEVEVRGLQTLSGQSASLSYTVDFGDSSGGEERPQGKKVSVSSLGQLRTALDDPDVGEIDLAEDISGIDSQLTANRSIIIDLSDHKLSFDDKGSLTVTNGTVTVRKGYVFCHSKELTDGEPLKVTGGTLNIRGNAHVVSYYVGAVAVSGSGTLKVTDATLEGGSERYAIVNASGSGTVEMNDVELHPSDGAACVSTLGSSSATVKFAKIYSDSPRGIEEYVPTGYAFKKSPYVDGIYRVQGDLSSSLASVTVSPKTVEYDGERKEPSVSVYYDGINVTSKCRITYENNRDVGTATVHVEPDSEIDALTGSRTATFEIVEGTDSDLGNATLTLSSNSYTYNGSEHKPTVTVKIDGTTVSSSDYDVEYIDNIDAGTATVTVTAKSSSNYSGSISDNFTIDRKEARVTANNASKRAGDSDPTFTATVTGTVGSDTLSYTLSRQSGETAGSYTITPKGSTEQGNYTVSYHTGTLTITGSNTSNSSSSTNNSTNSNTNTRNTTSTSTSSGNNSSSTRTTGGTTSTTANSTASATPAASPSNPIAVANTSTPANATVTPVNAVAPMSTVTPTTGDSSFTGYAPVIMAGGAAFIAGVVARMRARKKK